MAPEEITPVGGDAAGSPRAAWVRSAREIDETYAKLGVQMLQIAARGNRTATDLSVGEHYALGVRAAAQWTMGRHDTAPLTDEVLAADLDAVVKVTAIAEYLMSSDGTPASAVALASGVRAWLLWLVGVEDRMVFRPV